LFTEKSILQHRLSRHSVGDLISSSSVITITEQKRCLRKLVISELYTGTKAKVVTADGTTGLFEILVGVLQGDTLAPYLFIIVVDYITTLTMDDDKTDSGFTLKPARSRRVLAEKLAEVEFADDVALVTDTIEGAQLFLERLETAANSVGLAMNNSKTKFMTINTPEEECVLASTTGNQLEHVSDFIYLGSWVATTEKDLRIRKAELKKLGNLWWIGHC
jgi:hypothetical protein